VKSCMNSKVLFTLASASSISVHKSQDSSIGIVTSLQAGWCYSGQGKEIVPFSKRSRLALGPTQPHMHCTQAEDCSQGMKFATPLHQEQRLRMEGAVPMILPCLHGMNVDNFTLICVSVTRMNHKHRRNLKVTMSEDGP
jgi:hypothetical protein